MPALFTLPKQVPLNSGGELLPGAKLHFFATGTTNPQNTYTDIDLSTPHSNPVEADADGVFAPIYLDASLPHYRVRLTTSADVQLWQLDDIPSNQNTAQTYRLVSAAPELIFEETDVDSEDAKWSIRAQAESLSIDLLNAAESVRTNLITISRDGTVNFSADTLFVDGEAVSATNQIIRKTNITRTSTATLADDPVLTVNVSAQGYYILDAMLFVSSASAAPDFKYSFTTPSVDFSTIVAQLTNNVSGVATGAEVSINGDNVVLLPANEGYFIKLSGGIRFNAGGAFTLEWSQNTSDATGVTLFRGSYIKLVRSI